MVDTATWNGRLYSAPFNTNTQLLWYRKDLVPTPPKTWTQMIAMADELAKQGKPHYIEIQGAPVRGLHRLVQHARELGRRPDPRDATKVALARADAAALDVIQSWPTRRPPTRRWPTRWRTRTGSSSRAGGAAFELNYPYVYPSAKADMPDIFKNMRWTPYPAVEAGRARARDDRRHQLGRRRLLEAPGAGVRRGDVPAQRAERDRNAPQGGLPPVLETIYDDPAFQKAYPMWKAIRDHAEDRSVRPKTPAYRTCRCRSPTRCRRRESVTPRTSGRCATSVETRSTRGGGAVSDTAPSDSHAPTRAALEQARKQAR